jgi:hypothetical protein
MEQGKMIHQLEPITFSQGLFEVLRTKTPDLGMVLEYEVDQIQVRFSVERGSIHASHEGFARRGPRAQVPCYLKHHGFDTSKTWICFLELGHFRARKIRAKGAGDTLDLTLLGMIESLRAEGFTR